MLNFLPHYSHQRQPLDKTVYDYEPFKTFCNQAANRGNHGAANRGKLMTIHTLPHIINYGFVHAFNQKKNPILSLSGFKSTGIYPFDKNIIPEDPYLPSYTTDQPMKLMKESSTCTECSSALRQQQAQQTPLCLCHHLY
ncbi:transposase [Plakobranchus ocellatus]|uniref:Transposase n=1 Tax=Plakobranchus ocellatus TaxID=259542 RepID=A0AAV3XXM8_9GAST|nr:transposase [Plakobranchus ocellatus]